MFVTLKFVRQWGGNDQIVWVDIAKLNNAWRRDRGYYLARNSPNRTAAWIARLGFRKIPMSHICVEATGDVSFTDGRHRFAWFRDHGIKAVPVTVATRKDAAVTRRFYGSRRRSVRIKKSVFRLAFVKVAELKERQRAAEVFWAELTHQTDTKVSP
jgi:hypothetical protein